MIFDFSETVYKKNYAFPIRIAKWIFAVGFVCLVLAILLLTIDIRISIPDNLNLIIGIYWVISFLLFPILTITQKGQKRLVKDSSLCISSSGKIVYNKTSELLWTILGYTREQKQYTVVSASFITRKRCFYIICGDIQCKCFYNEKETKQYSVEKIRIPIAYNNMERIEEYAK